MPLASSPLIPLGDKLAAARRDQGLSKEALATRLRLGTSQLDALEAGDASRLPEGVFVIAQARRVAASLGINVDAELAALRASPRAELPRSKVAAAIDRGEGPPRRLPLLAVGLPVLVALLLAGFAAAALLRRPSAQNRPTVSAAPAPSAPQQAAPVRSSAPAAESAAVLVLTSRPASWVAVRDRDGLELFAGSLEGEKRFPLGQGLEVLAGRPDLVKVSSGAGEVRPLGTISEVTWHRFSPAAKAP